MARRDAPAPPPYVALPGGLVTADGTLFRTSEAALQDYAGAVLEREPLPLLIAQAETWLRSPQTLALWLLPFLLVTGPPWTAALVTLAAYIGWTLAAPGLVTRPLLRGFGWLEQVAGQALLYIGILSWLGQNGHYAALATGLAGFVLLRWGVIGWLLRPLQPFIDRRYPLRRPDQVLRAIIIRAALKHRLPLPEVDAIAAQMLERWRS